MGALDRKERVNCVWTKVVPFLFQASLLIPNDLFMFFCDLFISCVADSMHRKKKKKKPPSFRQCFVPGAFHGQALTDVLLTSRLLVEPHFAQEALSTQNAQPCVFLCFPLWDIMFIFFCFFFFVPYLALLRVQLSTKILSHQNFTSQYKKKTPCPESDTYCRNCKYGRFSHNYQELPTSFLVAA